MRVSVIAAMGKNRELGLDNKLLWHLPEDLKNFKRVTKGHHILMGRKTFESIGRPLPNRTTIILTRNGGYEAEGCLIVGSMEEGLKLAKKNEETELFICGGGQIYEEGLKIADRLYLTEVDFEGEADTFFPEFDEEEWKIVEQDSNDVDEYSWRFRVMERV